MQMNGYYKPTPEKIRKIADSVSSAIKVIGASTVIIANPVAGLVLMVLGEAVKIFSNFFVDDKSS